METFCAQGTCDGILNVLSLSAKHILKGLNVISFPQLDLLISLHHTKQTLFKGTPALGLTYILHTKPQTHTLIHTGSNGHVPAHPLHTNAWPPRGLSIEMFKQIRENWGMHDCWFTLCTLNISLFWPTAIIYKCLLNNMKYGLSKETLVYTQSQGLGSWMLGYTVWDPFSHHAIFSRHQCLPAKITWIWIVCSAVQSGLQQESNDSDRQPARTLCVFDKYWTSSGVSFGFQGIKKHKGYWALNISFKKETGLCPIITKHTVYKSGFI